MNPDTIHLQVVTPERAVVSETVSEVTLPGREGYLGILPGHTPLLTMLSTGVLVYRQGSQSHRLAVGGGFAEVLPDRVIVLADMAERPGEIDATKARADLVDAEKRLASAGVDDLESIQQAAGRARTRLEVASPVGAHGAEGHAGH